MITLKIVEGLIGRADAPDWLVPLQDASELFEIDTPARVAAFLAQCAHESSGFVRLEENMNYSASRLLAVFPRYFTPEQAINYAYHREAIANRVYANRLGNGDEASGDGWKYRGRGLIQLTGATNYRRCGLELKINLHAFPDLLIEPTFAAHSAAWFWHDRGCNDFVDAGDFEGLTRRINGGTIGLEDRIAWLGKVERLMA